MTEHVCIFWEERMAAFCKYVADDDMHQIL